MTIPTEVDTTGSRRVARITDRRVGVVEVTVTDLIGEVSAVCARIVADARNAIHVTLETGRIITARVMAHSTILDISSGHLRMATTAGSYRPSQCPPICATMPHGTDPLIICRIVTLGAEITAVDFVARQAIGRLRTGLDAVEEAKIQTMHCVDGIHSTAVEERRER